MVDATISRARLRDLACLGGFRLPDAGGAGLYQACASRRRAATDTPAYRQRHVAAPQSSQLAPRGARSHGITHR
jgi:hypothetical protein